MQPFSSLWDHPTVAAACARLAGSVAAVERELLDIQRIPAPTFAERERAAWVQGRFAALGLADVAMDEAGNVSGRLPGREAGVALLVTAHLDTVFPADTDLATRREAGRLYGPGIGDNSLGVAGLLALAGALRELPPRRPCWFAANVGEEGLGNLAGMRAIVARLRSQVGAVVVVEGGAFGVVIHGGIGVRRRRLVVETAGGHAWSDFGTPSAVHELCRIGAQIAALPVPNAPRTSFNLGTIAGGTGVNTIASEAHALLDLRSEEPATLDRLAARVDAIVQAARREGVVVRSEAIGDRPGGRIPATHPLVQAAAASLRRVGVAEPGLRAASTDANVPLALGIPAICIGLTEGHNAHRLDEYIELEPLAAGLQHALLTILAAQEWLP